MAPKLRRVLLSLFVPVALAVAPSSAHAAATPGVNLVTHTCPPTIAGKPVDPRNPVCDVEEAASFGARSVRLFVDWATAQPTAPSGSSDGIDMRYLESFRDRAARARALGMRTYLVVVSSPRWASGSDEKYAPPINPAAYANFVGKLAETVRGGSSVIYEIWNEQDETHFWKPRPDVARYVAMLKGAHGAVKAKDPGATVLFGALTGGNYEYLAAAYAAGAKGFFDGVAVHTDTACLTRPPDFYLRNNGPGLDGRINRYSFLAYREVRATMVANDDAKPIHMTELGWSVFTQRCDQAGFEDQPDRLGGVTALEQAANLRMAFRCLANDPYVTDALWFSLRDYTSEERSTSRYGLIGGAGPRPALGVFVDVARNGEPAGECGDFTAPTITPLLRATRFTGSLPIAVKAADAAGQVTRITLSLAGTKIRNFTGTDVGNDKVVSIDYQGAKQLPAGTHTLVVEALDLPGNTARLEVPVTKLDPSRMRQTEATTTVVDRVAVRRGRRALAVGYVGKAFDLQLRGKVRVIWETKRRVRGRLRWKKVHGGLRAAKVSPTGTRGRVQFGQRLRFPGAWRVRLVYEGMSPYKRSASPWSHFRAR